MKTLAIMQPYFLPYIGYFQLIQAADQFIVYDNIKYTKKGWINRNRYLQDGKDKLFSVALKTDSDNLDVRQREVSPDFKKDKFLNSIREAYRRAPHFEPCFSVVEKIVRRDDVNLFDFIFKSILDVCEYLNIGTDIVVSSTLPIDHSLAGADKVLALCRQVDADMYVNAIGGQALYSREHFHQQGIELKFLKTHDFGYKQFDDEFVPWLSIVDVMMFNRAEDIRRFLSSGYELI